jgi:ribosomal protein S18 acetylase RimI-like enzyme
MQNTTTFIRNATQGDSSAIIAIWEECNLVGSWNNPPKDIIAALENPKSTILLLCNENRTIGTVLVGFDGHRGWVYYLAVAKEFQKMGFGKTLVFEAEKWLKENNVPKMNLMIRTANIKVKEFYESMKYIQSDVITMEKWLNKGE